MAATADNPINLRTILIQSTTTDYTYCVPAIDLPVGYNPEGYVDPYGSVGVFSYLSQSEGGGWQINYILPFEIPTVPPAAGVATTTFLLRPYGLQSWTNTVYLQVVVTGTDPSNTHTYWVKTVATGATPNLSPPPGPGFQNQLNLRGAVIQSSSNPTQYFCFAIADFPDQEGGWTSPVGVEPVFAQVSGGGTTMEGFPPGTPDNFNLLVYPTNCLIPDSVIPQITYLLNPYSYTVPEGEEMPYFICEIDGINSANQEPVKVKGSATDRPVIVDPAISPVHMYKS